jgi:hypothetical protein
MSEFKIRQPGYLQGFPPRQSQSDFGEGKTVKTRKPHRCAWCYEKIEVGEDAYRYKGMFEGDWQNWHMHPECIKAFRQSGEEYFLPGENERPRGRPGLAF